MKNNPESGIFHTINQAERSSRDTLESIGQRFAFPVHEKIRNMSEDETLEVSAENQDKISKKDLVRVTLQSLRTAWEKTIELQINEIRQKAIDKSELKQGTDFATKVDIEGENTIKEIFINAFQDQLNIAGEEHEAHQGKVGSDITVRIDPIDGTESMKFGKPDWGIMVGIYKGQPANEQQIASAVFYPERKKILLNVEGQGIFTTDLETNIAQEIKPVQEQNELTEMIVQFYENIEERPNDQTFADLKGQLTTRQARLRSSPASCIDVLEAIETNGKRAMIINGGYKTVDFIPHAGLEKLGYKLYNWQGQELKADSQELTDQRIIIVPPGKAGQDIIEMCKNIQ